MASQLERPDRMTCLVRRICSVAVSEDAAGKITGRTWT